MPTNEKSWVFIVNPVAGGGSGQAMIPLIERMIEKHTISAEIVLTERKGHATELSKKYSELGYRNIIAVGGDGTINETARPLINKQDITIGIIPAGTGNDFNQILGFHDRFTESEWDTFFMKNTIPLDTGICNGKIFLNGMGLGFDAQVAAENYTESGEVKKGGKNKYIWHIIKTILFYREKKAVITDSSGSHEKDCFMNTVSIGRRFAGGFHITPNAIANDGLLDVCMVDRLCLPHRLKLLLQVPAGKHITDRKVHYYQTTGIRLKFPERVPFHLDGELEFSDEFDIGINPSSLNIIYNPDGQHFFRKQDS